MYVYVYINDHGFDTPNCPLNTILSQFPGTMFSIPLLGCTCVVANPHAVACQRIDVNRRFALEADTIRFQCNIHEGGARYMVIMTTILRIYM